MGWSQRHVIAGALLLAACGSDDGGEPLPGDPLPGGEVVSVPWLEAGSPPVASPEIAPCPDGWRAVVTADGLETCDPWPEAGWLDCGGADEAHFPGEPGCVRVGPACPADGWPEGLPADRPVVHVLAGTPAGGDGSREAPFSSISQGIAAVPDGGVVAVAAGVYEGSIAIAGRAVALWGACTLETRLSGGEPSDRRGLIHAEAGARVELRNLTIADTPSPALTVLSGASASLHETVLARARTRTVYVEGAGSTVLVERSAVRETQGQIASVPWGTGLMAALGGRLEARTVVLSDHSGSAITSAGAGAVVVLDNVAARRTRALLEDGSGAAGLWVELGARAEGRAAFFGQDRDAGIAAMDAGSAVLLEQVVVRDSGWDGGGPGAGRCVVAHTEGRVELSRALVEGCHGFGVVADDAGSVVALSDSVVREMRSGCYGPGAEGSAGVGLLASEGGRVEAYRARVERSRFAGASVGTSTGYPEGGQPSSAHLEDVVVVQTLPQERDGAMGVGLLLAFRAELVARRLVVREASSSGVYVSSDGASLDAEDLLVADTLGVEATGIGGRGLEVAHGGRATVRRGAFVRNREVAVGAHEEGSALALEDIVVVGALERLCVTSYCAGAGGGIGLGAYHGATTTATRFYVTGCALVGVQVAHDGQMDLVDGEVTGNLIGANVQVEGYDLDRIAGSVAYSGNDRNLDAATLPVPDATPPAQL